MKKDPRTYERMVTFCADCNETLDECMCEDDAATESVCERHKWKPAGIDPRFVVCLRCGAQGLAAQETRA